MSMLTASQSSLSPSEWRDLIDVLSQPFPKELIQFRVGSSFQNKAQALAYVDPREYEKRLDQVCPGQWQCSFQTWGSDRIICTLTIHTVSRSSTGEAKDGLAQGTAAEAQAFKRACSKFGLGRYLYDLKPQWLEYDPKTKKLLSTPKLHTYPQSLPSLPLTTEQTTEQTPHHSPQQPHHHSPQQLTQEETLTQHQEETLSRERATKMHAAIGALGYKREQHYDLAQKVLKRKIKTLTALTQNEAAQVYAYAKRAKAAN